MNSKLLLTQFGSTTFGRVVAAVLQGVSYALLARFVSPSDFGRASALLGLAMFAQAFVDLGFSTFVVRERAKSMASGAVTAALHFNDRLSTALCIASAVVILALGIWADSVYLYLLPLAIWVSAERNSSTWLAVAYADGDWRVNLATLIGKRVSALILFLILVVWMPPLLSFSLAWSTSSGISSLVARRYVVGKLPPSSRTSLRALFKESRSYWQHSLATQAKNIDVSFASAFAGPLEAALFAAASRITSPLRILPTSMATALLPAASRTRTRDDIKKLLRLVMLLLIAMIIFYALIFFLVPFLVVNVLGEDYSQSIVLIQIVVIGLPFAAGASLFGALLQGVGERRFVANVSLFVSIVYLLGVASISTVYGAKGASITLAASFVLQSLSYLVQLFRVYGKGEASPAISTQ